jgi:DNA-binding LacI/PurR family transcriptional regulator
VVAVVTEDRLADAFRDPMNLAVLDGIGEAFGEEELGLLLLPLVGADRPELLGAALDSAILLGCGTELVSTVATLRRRRVSIVGIETAPMDGVIAIELDNRAASRRGAELLRELGHRDAAVVTLPLDHARVLEQLTPELERTSGAFVATERLAGVREVFPRASGVAASASSVADGAAAARILLDAPRSRRPTAIVAQSDLLAAGILSVAEELGIRVPEELSVVGFDGIRFDGTGLQVLTTLVQPASDKGRAAGLAVLAALAGEQPLPASLRAELRIGATTAAPPRA